MKKKLTKEIEGWLKSDDSIVRSMANMIKASYERNEQNRKAKKIREKNSPFEVDGNKITYTGTDPIEIQVKGKVVLDGNFDEITISGVAIEDDKLITMPAHQLEDGMWCNSTDEETDTLKIEGEKINFNDNECIIYSPSQGTEYINREYPKNKIQIPYSEFLARLRGELRGELLIGNGDEIAPIAASKVASEPTMDNKDLKGTGMAWTNDQRILVPDNIGIVQKNESNALGIRFKNLVQVLYMKHGLYNVSCENAEDWSEPKCHLVLAYRADLKVGDIIFNDSLDNIGEPQSYDLVTTENVDLYIDKDGLPKRIYYTHGDIYKVTPINE